MHWEKFGESRVKFSSNFIASLLNTYKTHEEKKK